MLPADYVFTNSESRKFGFFPSIAVSIPLYRAVYKFVIGEALFEKKWLFLTDENWLEFPDEKWLFYPDANTTNVVPP